MKRHAWIFVTEIFANFCKFSFDVLKLFDFDKNLDKRYSLLSVFQNLNKKIVKSHFLLDNLKVIVIVQM